MTMSTVNNLMDDVIKKNPHQPEFIQAVSEVLEDIYPVLENEKKYSNGNIIKRLVEPERVIIFRVSWLDDDGNIRINRGYRVQYNSALGPYKGGLRFHPTVNLSVLKFLGFEQTFKNALTTLPLGGGKGGSDFDPRGKSDNEVMKFCQSFMTELSRHIGSNTDVPAGDIGVGSREIGFLFGQYKRLKNIFDGTLTGKKISWGGSEARTEATGYGTVYFAEHMLKTKNNGFNNKKVVISGSGNVAQYACKKVIELGGKVITLSDSSGYIYDPDGITLEKLYFIFQLKNVRRGRIKEYADYFKCEFYNGKPWNVPCDIALPCATQNEINKDEAEQLIKNGCMCVTEGANMPCSADAVAVFNQAKILHAPGKASNAGGVATSGLEMSQNSLRMNWSFDEVDSKLQFIMNNIHSTCVEYGQEKNYINYFKGANISSFIKVADAMLDQGCV